jgi:hypothetical protein
MKPEQLRDLVRYGMGQASETLNESIANAERFVTTIAFYLASQS